MQGLSKEQLDLFHQNGYLIIEDALPPDVVQELKDEISKLLNGFSLEGHPMTRFTTGGDDDEKKHVGDEYFLESGDKVRFFFEEDAFNDSGTLAKPPNLSINKIGHALHTLSPPFRALTISPQNAQIARDLGFKDPRVLQSMVICKQPEIGGAVPPHQDSAFLYTDPPSAVGFWYAVEDAGVGGVQNGCLSFVPGSHGWAPLRRRFVRVEGGGTGFVELGEGRGDGVTERFGRVEVVGREEFVMAPVKSGSLVLIDGNVLHKSERNNSTLSRWIYTFHVIEGDNEYDEKNWLQPTSEGFSKLNDAWD